MHQVALEAAEEYDMPETERDGFAASYLHTPIGKIRSYSMAQLALEFYGPMFLLYSVYDGTEEKSAVSGLLSEHIDRFIRRMEAERMDVK